MADGIPPRPTESPSDAPGARPEGEPPPLDAIRIKGQGAKGLNKPAILAAAGTGIAVVLVLASGAFGGDRSRKPADSKPMMSDPARPEMAKGAIRTLPSDYSQVPAPPPATAPNPPPRLGPPLPGDVAAFAQPHANLRSYSQREDQPWLEPATHEAVAAPDPAEVEARQAERSDLFFALRQKSASDDMSRSLEGFEPPSASLHIAARPSAPPETVSEPATTRGVLFPGAVIAASLVTELNSESAGPVIAQVTQAVYDSATGLILLVPQGARLIGDYRSSTRYGQSRISIIWSRLIMPDGREIALAEASVDPSGAAGVGGRVDDHWGDVFSAAALGTLINVGVATTEDPQLSFGGVGIVGRDPVDAAIADGVQRTASTVTDRVVDRGLAIPPTIRVSAGTKLAVIVTRRTAL